MSFDAVFEQPDIDPDSDSDDLTGVIPSYPATATRDGSSWVVLVDGLPDGHAVRVRAATWHDAEIDTHARVADVLEAEPATFLAPVKPADPDAAAALMDLQEARIALAFAEQAVRDAARHAARTLTDQGWTARDAGTALRLPHERVSQLAPRTTP
ncbi:hypothetical protein ACIBSV_43720 [Embleya sp. NPDC050154]|uniref:hypothetical protein n=1 Tax=Embleya sp. NPDC050154 TaxID=3363988 RepID=UPI0037A35A6F